MTSSALALQARWFACLPAMPWIAFQAKALRSRIPRLPEAAGPKFGVVPSVAAAQSVRLVVVGESTAVGVGVELLDQGIPAHLSRALAGASGRAIEWQVWGKNGATAARCLRELRQCSGRFDAAVVLLGVNDVFRLTSVQSWRGNLAELIRVLHERHGCQSVLLSSVPPIQHFPALPQPLRSVLGTRASLLDHHLRIVAQAHPRVSYCAVEFPSDTTLVAEDGVHPSALGYREWAEQLAIALLSSAPTLFAQAPDPLERHTQLGARLL
jgi:lysophospholipase L1-like esterase